MQIILCIHGCIEENVACRPLMQAALTISLVCICIAIMHSLYFALRMRGPQLFQIMLKTTRITWNQRIKSRFLNQHYQVDLINVRLFQSFWHCYSVAHNKLLIKLEHYGIQSNTHFWLQAWVTNRIQKVIVEGESSNTLKVLSGVSQGTFPGPLMFLLYINDIAKCWNWFIYPLICWWLCFIQSY